MGLGSLRPGYDEVSPERLTRRGDGANPQETIFCGDEGCTVSGYLERRCPIQPAVASLEHLAEAAPDRVGKAVADTKALFDKHVLVVNPSS